MSRRGNRHANVVAERFFNRLKRACIQRRTHATREARQDVFAHIEMYFYNSVRKHVRNKMLPSSSNGSRF